MHRDVSDTHGSCSTGFAPRWQRRRCICTRDILIPVAATCRGLPVGLQASHNRHVSVGCKGGTAVRPATADSVTPLLSCSPSTLLQGGSACKLLLHRVSSTTCL
jgi:hypothetical protein